MLHIDEYAYSSSYRNVHPLEKGIFVLLFLFFSLVTKKPESLIIIFLLMSAATIYGAGIPLRYYLKLLLLPLFFFLMSLLPIMVSIAPVTIALGETLLEVSMWKWKIFISYGNMTRGIELLFSVLASISCMYFLILTTPIHQMIWLMQKMRLPHLFIELFMLVYRFIFILMKHMQEIRTAQVSRLGYDGFRKSFLSLGNLILGIFIKSMRTAKEVQIASDSRVGSEGMSDIEMNLPFKHSNWFLIFAAFLLLSIVNAIF